MQFFFLFSSELAGGTPHTVRCNIEVALTICSFFFHLNWQVAHLIQSDVTYEEAKLFVAFFFSSELAGGTPHTVRCNIEVGLTICSFFFSSELAGGTPHTVRCNIEVGLTIL